jgi:hypothetical protein
MPKEIDLTESTSQWVLENAKNAIAITLRNSYKLIFLKKGELRET